MTYAVLLSCSKSAWHVTQSQESLVDKCMWTSLKCGQIPITTFDSLQFVSIILVDWIALRSRRHLSLSASQSVSQSVASFHRSWPLVFSFISPLIVPLLLHCFLLTVFSITSNTMLHWTRINHYSHIQFLSFFLFSYCTSQKLSDQQLLAVLLVVFGLYCCWIGSLWLFVASKWFLTFHQVMALR